MSDKPSSLLDIGADVLARQPFSVMLGTRLLDLVPGEAVLMLDVSPDHLQQDGFVHGGVVAYLVDNAITFAAGSVAGTGVVTAEFKINFVRPAMGSRLIATATIDSPGEKLTVCRCRVEVETDGSLKTCALGQGTIFRQRQPTEH